MMAGFVRIAMMAGFVRMAMMAGLMRIGYNGKTNKEKPGGK